MIAVFCMLLTAPTAVFAHATLVSSQPTEGAVVASAPASAALTFNEPVSPLVLKLVAPDGSATLLDRFRLDDTTLRIDLPETGDGTHVLSWRVVSADGHPIGGSLVFSIGAASAGGAPSLDVSATPRGVFVSLWLAKIAIYAGLFFGVGGVFFNVWVARSRLAARFIRAILIAGLIALPLAVVMQGLDALELPLAGLTDIAAWRTGFATSFGNTALLAALAILLAALAFEIRANAIRPPLSAMALFALGLTLAASGHAADAAPHWLTRPAVFLHAMAIAFWLGALVPLAATLAAPRSSTGPSPLARFSRAIPLPLAVLLAAGTVLAVVQVETPKALLSTAYGRLLTAKLFIVAILLVLAAYNRWRLSAGAIEGASASAQKLRRTVLAEIVLATVVLGIVAAWRFTPPPRVIAIEASRPVSVHLHGDKAMADVTITPGRAGASVASIFVVAPDFDPLPAKEITLSLANPAAGIEPIRRKAAAVDGGWRIDDLTIPLAGTWTVGVDVLISDFEVAKLTGDVQIRP